MKKIKKTIGTLMGHEVGSYICLNEIKSLNPMTNFITISYLFNCIFGFIRYYFLNLSIRIFLGLSISIFVYAYK